MGRLAADDLVQDRAQQVDVAGLVDALDRAAGHFRRHVGRRAAQAVGLVHGVDVGELGRDPRQAPVHHQHFAVVAEHDVFRLQVAMNHAAGVGEGHRVGHAQQDAQVLVELLLVDHLVPRRAVDALHRVEQRAFVVRAQVVNRHDVRMVELAGDDRFGDELVALVLADLGRRLEHLHGHGAGDRRLMGRVDHAHAAFADDVAAARSRALRPATWAAHCAALRFSRT